MDISKALTISKFTGLDNVDLPTRLDPVPVGHEYTYPLQRANNVDIDNTMGLRSRSGYTKIVSGSACHSFWTDEKLLAFYADGVDLLKLQLDMTTITLRSDLQPGARLSYAPFNDRVYYTNGFQIGYVKGDTNYSLVDPGKNFKLPLPAGKFIEYFLGCLYVAKGNILYISDPLCDYYDVRTGFKLFSDEIQMLHALEEDGIYISDKLIWFCKGKSAEDFHREHVYPSAAIPYTDITILGKYIDDQIDGQVAMWTAEDGICRGNVKGDVVNLTQEKHVFGSYGQGTAYIRNINHVRHYINSLY